MRSVWVIRDRIAGRSHEESTGCAPDARNQAEKKLTDYIFRTYGPATPQTGLDAKHSSEIHVRDVVSRYMFDIASNHARPTESKAMGERLLKFWGSRKLSEVNGASCRAYWAGRKPQAARRELSMLRAAVNHFRREGFCREVIQVVMPPKAPPRERWLTREEAAKLIFRAWNYREKQNYRFKGRRTRKHVAKFTIVACYTGSRAGVICSASFDKIPGRGWIDLDRGIFYRRPLGEKATKKQKPPIPLPPGLLAHMRRWRKRGARFVVEWEGKPVSRMNKAFRSAVKDAGLGREVIPHILRHTAATWLMQGAADPWEAAGYLGMTVDLLIRNYGHHHPALAKGVHAAFARAKAKSVLR